MKPLHHKTHTLAKRGLSLLCVLALCLGLLPVTAEAAAEGAPSSLYVGNQQVISSSDITYWTTDKSTGGLTKYEGNNDNWNVKYDPNTVTLTLSGATIQGGSDVVSIPYGSGIYAQGNSNQPVALTIELIGTNTITGTFGIYVSATPPTTPGTDASLVIKNGGDNGSLTVTGTGNSGLLISSGTGNASLTIKNVSVVANTTSSYSGSGVCVQSGASATDSPNISLSVDGGSLTASGTGSCDGILFYVGSSQATGATTSLTVSENAIVDARNGGISADGVSVKPNVNIGSTGGIVFDGTEGTVYGEVTLQENLTIGEGESLTIPSGSSLNCNGMLTNNGTILASGGTVTGSLSGGSTVTTPNITAQPTGQTVTEGTQAAFSVSATAGSETPTYQWQQSTDNGGSWTDISGATEASYTTGTTTTSMSGYQYRCVVKSASGVGVISSAATLTVNALTTYTINATANPAEGGTATADKTTAAAGETVTLTATANPGYRFTSWTSVGGGTFANSSSANTTFTMPSGDVTVTAKFEQVYTVTVSSTAGGTATADKTTAAAGETVTLTATPNNGYRFTGWTFSDNVIGADVSSKTTSFIMPAGDVTATANFAKIPSVTPSTPPTVSEETTDAIADAQPGETVTVDLSSGSTTLDKDVFETLAGKDVTLVVELGDDVSWTVKGSDIPEDADFTDIDLNVTMGSDGIPVDVVNAITGERSSVQITLAHNGEFGFTMTLTAPLGKENAGYWANLYHYDEADEQLTFEAAAKIDEDGSVTIPFSHASQYAIVIDTHSHATVDVSDIFIDVAPNAWYKDAVQYAYDNGLMTGTSANEFAPEATTTRAMIVSILARLEGVESAEAAGFADVDDEWYATAVNWAANVGVVNGYEDNTFRPNTAITREQLAAILMNYAAYKGEDVSNRAALDNYTDQPSAWAKEAISWSVAEGLLTGVTADTLQPQGAATRAQVAAILQRFLAQ